MNAKLLMAMELDSTRENRVLRKLLRAPRYFDYSESNWLACNEFSGDDDKSNKGKAKKRRKPCYICGDINHSGTPCLKVPCDICSAKGHLVINCPNKTVELACVSTPCLKCGNTDHDMFSCTDDYDPEDLKAIECYICKEAGHLCCAENKAEGPTEASCYCCGQFGHFGSECTKLNEVIFDPHLFCHICKERGHSRKQCPKKAKAKLKRKYWIARRRKNFKQTPTGCTSSSRPEEWRLPPVAGPNSQQ